MTILHCAVIKKRTVIYVDKDVDADDWPRDYRSPAETSVFVECTGEHFSGMLTKAYETPGQDQDHAVPCNVGQGHREEHSAMM